MGDYNAVSEAGLSLVELFRREMTPQPIARPETIGLCMPQEPEDFQLTVWIYLMEEYNDTGMTAGYRSDPANLQQERYAPMQLRCHGLVTAHSKAPVQGRLPDEYRILGRAMQIIRDNPVIPPERLEGSLAADQTGLQVTHARMGMEELSKVWNTANRMYKPSFGIVISSFSIESNRIRSAGTRVASATIDLVQKK